MENRRRYEDDGHRMVYYLQEYASRLCLLGKLFLPSKVVHESHDVGHFTFYILTEYLDGNGFAVTGFFSKVG